MYVSINKIRNNFVKILFWWKLLTPVATGTAKTSSRSKKSVSSKLNTLDVGMYMSDRKKNQAFFVFHLDIWFPFQELTHFYKHTYIYYIFTIYVIFLLFC